MTANIVSRPSSGGILDGSRERKGFAVTDDSTVHVERGPFEMVPHWILFHPELSALAVRLYLALRRHADAKGDCFPSRKKLADLLGVGVPTLDRARKQLVSAGAIEIRQRRAPDDRWLTSMYRVRWHPRIEMIQGLGSQTIHAGNENEALTQTQLSTKTQDQEHDRQAPLSQGEAIEYEPPTGLSGASAGLVRLPEKGFFEDFWHAYPRKVGKRAARDAFTDAAKDTDPRLIVEAAKRFAADPNREQQFTPHPTTWLRQGRWEDEPLPARKTPQTGGARRMDNYADIHASINRAKGISAS